jgi:DNA primase
VFAFVMNYDRLSFRETLEMLANRANIPIPTTFRPEPAEEKDNKNRWYEILAWAEQTMHEALLQSPQGARGREYFRGRHLSPATVNEFRLGYHPPEWSWLVDRARGRYSPDELVGVRLAGTRESGGYRDEAMFIDRVIFPIRDARGRTVAFGGRVIPGSEKEFGGKYMNSGEFALFSKSRLVYGFEQAREAIKKSGTVVVTEGYMDCIAAQQCGIKNVVATLGTALTEHHVSFLKRFARKVVLVYDGDEAGRNAAERSLPRFLAQEIDLRVLTLPGDQDPADFLEGNSPEAFETLIETAAEAWQFKLRGLVERVGLATIDARHRVLREMLDTIAQVPVSASGEQSSVWMLRKDIILGGLSQQLGIPERTVRERLAELQKTTAQPVRTEASSRPREIPKEPPTRDPQVRMEWEIVELILVCPESCADLRSEISTGDFTNPDLRTVFEVCLKTAGDGPWRGFEQVLTAIEDPDLKSLVVALERHARAVNTRPELVGEVLDYFRRKRLEAAIRSGAVNSSAALGAVVAYSENSLGLTAELSRLSTLQRSTSPGPTSTPPATQDRNVSPAAGASGGATDSAGVETATGAQGADAPPRAPSDDKLARLRQATLQNHVRAVRKLRGPGE